MCAKLLVNENLVLPPIKQAVIVPIRATALIVGSWVVGFLLVTGGVDLGATNRAGTIVLGLLVGIGAVVLLRHWINWARTTITVTDQRVILESGPRTRVFALDVIVHLGTVQTTLGKIFRFGSLEIELSNGDVVSLNGCAELEMLRDQLFVLCEKVGRDT